MKKYHTTAAWLLCLIAVLIAKRARCQGPDPKKSLIIVNTRTQEQIGIVAGQKLQYRLRGSDKYVHATLVDVTDSTVSFQDKDNNTVSAKLADLVDLKVPRNSSRRTTGTVFTIVGGLATFIGIVSAVSGKPEHDNTGIATGSYTAGLIIGAVGVPMLIGGIALKSPHKIDLEKGKWKLTSSTSSSPAKGFPEHRPAFGLHANYTTSSVAGFGIGAHGEFFISDKLSVQPAFDYYFHNGQAYNGFGPVEPSGIITGDAHYYFTKAGAIKAYGLGGVSFLLGGSSDKNILGVNVGVGSTFGNSSVRPFAELKYNSPLSGVVITAGFKFGGK